MTADEIRQLRDQPKLDSGSEAQLDQVGNPPWWEGLTCPMTCIQWVSPNPNEPQPGSKQKPFKWLNIGGGNVGSDPGTAANDPVRPPGTE